MNVNIDVMRSRLDEIDSELRALDTEAGEARLDETQQARWNELDAESATLRSTIETEEKRAETRARWSSVAVAAPKRDAFDLTDMRGASADMWADRAREAFDPAFARRGASEAAAEVLRKIDTFSDADSPQAGDLARYAMVHGSDAYRSAFRSLLGAQARGVAAQLTAAEADAMRASLSLGTGTGGYALPTLLDPTLIYTGTATSNPLRRISTVKQGTQDKWHGVTVGGVTTAWKGEGSAFTDGTPADGAVTIDAAMLTAYVTGSYEIFQDSGWLADLPPLIGEAVDFAEGTAFISGSGSDAPMGIVTAISATTGSTVTATTRGAFTSASAADTLALLNALPVRFEDSSTWVMNKATYRTIAQQVIGTDGVKMIDMTDRNVLLDLPVVRASDMPSATTSGNILAVLGDFSRFVIYDRLGMNVEFIQNVVDGNGLPVGKRGLVAYKRVGSNVSDVNAFRFLKA